MHHTTDPTRRLVVTDESIEAVAELGHRSDVNPGVLAEFETLLQRGRFRPAER